MKLILNKTILIICIAFGFIVIASIVCGLATGMLPWETYKANNPLQTGYLPWQKPAQNRQGQNEDRPRDSSNQKIIKANTIEIKYSADTTIIIEMMVGITTSVNILGGKKTVDILPGDRDHLDCRFWEGTPQRLQLSKLQEGPTSLDINLAKENKKTHIKLIINDSKDSSVVATIKLININ